MEMTISLRGQGGDVLLEPNINELGWTRCYLLTPQRIFLGADGLPYVTAGLLKAVGDVLGDDLPSGEIAGHRVQCAFLLCEAHHALYYADDGQDRLLFWQNAHSSPMPVVGTIRLSPAQRRQWQMQLNALSKSPPEPVLQSSVTKEVAEIAGGA